MLPPQPPPGAQKTQTEWVAGTFWQRLLHSQALWGAAANQKFILLSSLMDHSQSLTKERFPSQERLSWSKGHQRFPSKERSSSPGWGPGGSRAWHKIFPFLLPPVREMCSGFIPCSLLTSRAILTISRSFNFLLKF